MSLNRLHVNIFQNQDLSLHRALVGHLYILKITMVPIWFLVVFHSGVRTLDQDDCSPFRTTHCFLLHKKSVIHAIRSVFMLYVFNLNRSLCGEGQYQMLLQSQCI